MRSPPLTFGRPLPRREDDRFIRGEGTYTDDLHFPGMLHAVMVRSPHAHAQIRSIDVRAAKERPGVAAILTAAEVAADGLRDLISPADVRRPGDGEPPKTPKSLLVEKTVRFAGEPIAMVVANTLALAQDAAEAVVVDYEERPAVATAADAMAPGAPAVWDQAPDNIAFYWSKGENAECEEAFGRSHHVVQVSSAVSRVVAAPLEPRISIGVVDGQGRSTIYTSNQAPYTARAPIAHVFGLEPKDIRIVAKDVGGSFGLKYGAQREDALVLWAARRLGCPVRWICGRTEAFIADEHARDARIETTLGLDAEGNFTALRVVYHINIGAYLAFRSLSHLWNFGGIAGVYRTPLIAGEAYGILTHTQPTTPYRGAGRPDATYAIERAIDIAARDLGIDPYELRLRNLIPSSAMPYKTPFLFTYDCGDFALNMQLAARLADYQGFPQRRETARGRGRLRGLGIANPIEIAAGPLHRISTDYARVQVNSDGGAVLYVGAMSTGTGLETTLSEIVSRRLGMPIEAVRYVQGDTDQLLNGKGSGSSSGLAIGGGAVAYSIDKLITRGLEIAARHFDAAAADVEFADGVFRIPNTNHAITLKDVARFAETDDPSTPLLGEYAFTPNHPTYPNGCHICEVEIDPETGAVDVVNYVAVEDVGRVLNAMLVEGQIHGGVVQGIGQALKELIAHDPTSAQLVTGSFMDYGMPRASDYPHIICGSNEVPTASNPLGAKGAAEAGTVGAIAATMNAVCDALAPCGVRHFDMPANPARVWHAIQASQKL